MATKRPGRGIRLTRDLVLFIVGVAGIIWEAGFVEEPRTSLLILYAAMCGVPVLLRANGV